VTALVQADVARLVDDAQQLLLAVFLQPLARFLACDVLLLPDVRDGAELLALRRARVDGDDRDVGLDRVLDGTLERVRIGHRHHDAVDLAGNGVVDQPGLRARVAVGGVLHANAELLTGVLRAVLDHVPEGVTLCAVGDDYDVQVTVAAASATAAALAAIRARRSGARDHQRRAHGNGQSGQQTPAAGGVIRPHSQPP